MRAFWHRRSLGLTVATVTDRGLVRTENQDHLLADVRRGIFCVADGMGGGEGGAKASSIVCEQVLGAADDGGRFAERIVRLDAAIESSHRAIQRYAERAGYDKMATTVLMLAVDVEACGSAVVGHVGDSRLYRLRGGVLSPLTIDHTVATEVARSIASGAMVGDPSCLDDRYSHVLVRAVGFGEAVEVEWHKLDLRKDDCYLLCSDGVYDMIPSDRMEAILGAGGAPAEMVGRLERAVREAGAYDNYTAVIVRVD